MARSMNALVAFALVGGASAQYAPQVPTSCPTFREFITFSDLVTQACCPANAPCPAGDIPTYCSAQCATVLRPMQSLCAGMLNQIGMTATVQAAVATCPIGGGTANPFGPAPPPPTNPFGPPPPPTGATGCTAPLPLVVGGMYTAQFGGVSATLQCNYGFTPSAYGTAISCTNNFWSQAGMCTQAGGAVTPPPPPGQNCLFGSCTGGATPPPPTNPFGPPPPAAGGGCTAQAPIVVGGMYTVQLGGASATLQCNYGFTPSAYGVQITCTNNFWSQAGTCAQAGGVPPPPPVNPFGPPPPPTNPFGPPPPAGGACTAQVPIVVGGMYTAQFGGASATLQCNYGFTPSAYGVQITCTNNFWSQAGTCAQAGGVPPPPPTNPFGPPPPAGGTCTTLPVIDPATGIWTQSTATDASLQCMYGYAPSSAATRVSCVGGLWTPPNDAYGNRQQPANCGQHHRRRQLRGE